MKRVTAVMNYLFLAGVMTGIIGCSKTSPSFSLLPDSETFFQNSGAIASKVDLLWVVDNSGSMHSSQVNLASNFNSFISDFSAGNFDYQIGVIATDAFRSEFTTNPNYSLLKSAGGTSIITPDTENIIDTFIGNVMVGTTGWGDERPFQSMKVALDNPANAGLLRPDSFLAVIIVSDEDDFSNDTSSYLFKQYTAYTDPMHSYFNAAQNHTTDKYVEYLEGLTGTSGLSKQFSVNSIVIKDGDSDCLTQLGDSSQIYGKRIQELSDKTNGINGSLCGDFAEELKAISENILTLSTQFFLKRDPDPATIVVKVNNETIPSVEANPGPLKGGWVYNAEANSILFYGDYIPAAGSQITIDFDPITLEL